MSTVDDQERDETPASSVASARLILVFAAIALAAPLAACKDHSVAAVERPAIVRTDAVQSRDVQAALTLTGDVQPRFPADLSFRVSGRVIARQVDVGDHVNAGEVLARLDPAEQQADVDAATAGLAAAQAQLRVAQATFERQSSLISSGFTTSTAYDKAKEGLRTAESALDAAKAQLGTAKDALGYTELRAEASGVITVRQLEVGQVVQSAQPVFTLAPDGERDAVFDVPELMLLGDVQKGQIALKLVSDTDVTAMGQIWEISPVVDPKSLTVRVKVAIHNPPAAMALGSAVTGTAVTKPAQDISLPWTALMAAGSKPAVWIVDSKTKTARLKPVTVSGYKAGTVQITGGLEVGERVIVDGGKLLSPGEPVN
ncbi:RND family efflux transporter MFP subunit [Bradyrhizobium niftali]|uniref:efflux RND transporter periplasmic adaptor subunit n=1 Tax=Bradyrhizobium niftali TaxID=2560055 RepID=UPI0038337444